MHLPCKQYPWGEQYACARAWQTADCALQSRLPESGGAFADKTNLDGFEYWISIFNYQAPCGWSPIPPIEDIIQVCGPSWQGQPLVLVQSPATVTCVLAYALMHVKLWCTTQQMKPVDSY